MQAMDVFLEDFEAGKAAGRYVEAELPTLPFPDGAFDLAVCSHLLFLYTSQLGEAFHRAAIREMCRVAAEVRIFPLLALGGQRSPYVETGVAEFRGAGFAVTLERVSYEFQRGGNQMLRIRRAELSDG
jgi:SAM-dependent methyltransferase